MKVILKQTVPNVGKEDAVVNVAGGYARNFLFPRGMATVADRSQLKALEAKKARMESKLAATKAGAEATKEKLEGLVVTLEGKVGKDAGKLFGAITAQDIADAIKKATKVDLEKKQVGLLEAIKRLGSYPIVIDLHRDVDAHITVQVVDPNAPVEAAPVAEEVQEPTEALVEA